MRILLANSNTTPAVTEAVLAAARDAAAPGTELVGATAAFGPRIVGSRTEAAIAAHALLDMLAEHANGCDAVLLAMSFDSGLWAARELVAMPVIGMTEAACLAACTMGRRFGLLTLRARGPELYREVVAEHGLEARLAGVRELEATPQDILADPPAFEAAVLAGAEAMAREYGAEAVVLVGAVMGSYAAALRDRSPVPLIDGIAAGVVLAESVVRLGASRPTLGTLKPLLPRESTGLRPPLEALLRKGGG